MMNENNIHRLLERFLNAETTLEEEQTLYQYFQSSDVADELEPYREVFLGFAAVKGIDKPKPEPAPRTSAWIVAIRTIMSSAAVFLVGLFVFLQMEPMTSPTPSNGEENGSSTSERLGEVIEQQPSTQPTYCTEGTPQEILMCYLERRKEQPSTYSLIKQKIYESQH